MAVTHITRNIDFIMASAAAVSAFLSCVVVAWPYLQRDNLAARMRAMADEREAIRVRERKKMQSGRPSLRTAPKKIFQDILDRFKLAEQLNDSAMVTRLRTAGYRGQGPIVTFIAARVLLPAAFFTVAASYLFLAFPHSPFFTKLAISMTLALLGYYTPALYVKNVIEKRQKAIRRTWPDALDLLLICVQSGMGLESALVRVSEEISSQCAALAEELVLTTAELSYLSDRHKAFDNFARRIGLDEIKALVISLGQSEKYGTSLGQSLRVLAQESRDARMLAAEKKA